MDHFPPFEYDDPVWHPEWGGGLYRIGEYHRPSSNFLSAVWFPEHGLQVVKTANLVHGRISIYPADTFVERKESK